MCLPVRALICPLDLCLNKYLDRGSKRRGLAVFVSNCVSFGLGVSSSSFSNASVDGEDVRRDHLLRSLPDQSRSGWRPLAPTVIGGISGSLTTAVLLEPVVLIEQGALDEIERSRPKCVQKLSKNWRHQSEVQTEAAYHSEGGHSMQGTEQFSQFP